MDAATKRALDTTELLAASRPFRRKLEEIKKSENGIAWYPYDSLANLNLLDEILTGEFRNLLQFAGSEPILDIGCGDGDLSFFLESLGFAVTAVDYAPSNYNAMRGVEHVKRALGAHVAIHSVDLDAAKLPDGNAGLVFLLGVMYHLKNPLGLLEELSRRARYCMMSTRVMQLTPDRYFLRNVPVAYLLDRDELNRDETNFWIFTEAGFRRMLDRAHWEILELAIVGEEAWSDPRSLARDARLFCFARSRRRTDPAVGVELLEGWHELDMESRRWTSRRFSAALPMPAGMKDPAVKLRFAMPDALASQGPVTLTVSTNGSQLPQRVYSSSGDHLYREKIPAEALSGSPVRVRFELDKSVAPSGIEQRDLGVYVEAIAIEPAGVESVAEASLDLQKQYFEERLVKYAAQLREADSTIEDRSQWAFALQAECDRRGKELAECVELLAEAEKTATERSEWAMKLQRELEAQTRELLESNRLLKDAHESADQQQKRAATFEAALNLLQASRWVRLGRRLGFARRPGRPSGER